MAKKGFTKIVYRYPKKKAARRYGRRLRRRIGKAKIPFETLIGVGIIPFTPAQDGWNTPLEYVQTGDYRGAVESLKSGFLGMDPATNTIDIFRALNPFDMGRARYSKIIMMATLAGMVRRKLTGRYTAPLMKKIPIIGRIVS